MIALIGRGPEEVRKNMVVDVNREGHDGSPLVTLVVAWVAQNGTLRSLLVVLIQMTSVKSAARSRPSASTRPQV